MNKRYMPISDFMNYIHLQYSNFPNKKYNSILDLVVQYCEETCEENILIYYDNPSVIYNDWCMFDNFSKFNNISGILLNNKNKWGISEICPSKRYTTNKENNFCWIIDDNHLLGQKVLSTKDWKKYGALTKFFEYDNYVTNKNYILGERILTRGMQGRDVFQLQKTLYEFDNTIQITCEYDEQTINAYKKAQKCFCLTPNEDFDGEKDELLCLLN